MTNIAWNMQSFFGTWRNTDWPEQHVPFSPSDNTQPKRAGQRHCRTPAMPRLDRIGKKSPNTSTENAKWHLICIVQVPVEGVHVWALYPIQ